MINQRLPGETDKQFTIRVYEEKLEAVRFQRQKLEREEAYWERAVAYQKLEEVA